MLKKVLYITLAICLSACCAKKQTSAHATPDTTITDVSRNDIASANGFWGKAFNGLCKTSTKENICLSPLSAQYALAMVANGADGKTKEELYKALAAGSNVNAFYKELLTDLNTNKEWQHCEVNVANSIWINDKLSVKEPFITENKENYEATIETVAFNDSTLKRINDWCKEKTKEKIASILEDINPNDRMYLINALYFNAVWNKKFNKENTKKEKFTTENSEIVEVEMMKQRDNSLYCSNEDFEITLKGYYDGKYSMLLALPKKNMDCGEAAQSIMRNLNKYLLEMERCEVDLSMPKFTVEFGSSLKHVLEQQGITRAFGSRAQFEGISDEPLCISDVMQKTYIKVDEDGTEAAAVTAVRVGAMSMRPRNVVPMKLDRPFVFAIIRNDGNEVLFVGKVGNPIEK